MRRIGICAAFGLFQLFFAPHELLAQGAGLQGYVAVGGGKIGDKVGGLSDDGIAYMSAGVEHVGVRGVGVGGEIGRVSGIRSHDFSGNQIVVSGNRAPTTIVTPELVIARQIEQSRVTGFFHTGVGFLDKAVSDSLIVLLFAGGVDTRLSSHAALRTGLTVMMGLGGGTGIVSAGIVFR